MAKTMTITLPDEELKSKVKKFAKDNRRSLSNSVAYLIEKGLEYENLKNKGV